MKLLKKYEFDWKFYLVSIFAIILIIVVFTVARRMIIRAQGKEVQKLLVKTNLASVEESKKRAKNYVRGLAIKYKFTPSERKKVEEIFTRAFQERMDIWIQDRLQGKTEAYTRQRQSQSWDKYQQEFQQFRQKRQPH